MKLHHQLFGIAILTVTANANSPPPPEKDIRDISHPPTSLQSPATAAIISPSPSFTSTSEWLQTISMTLNNPSKLSRPSRPPSQSTRPSIPTSASTATISGDDACPPPSGSEPLPSQTQSLNLQMGYVDATAMEWVFTWRKCGGGYESSSSTATSTASSEAASTGTSTRTSTTTEEETKSEEVGVPSATSTEGVQSSTTSFEIVEGSVTGTITASGGEDACTTATTTATETETKWFTVTETATARLP